MTLHPFYSMKIKEYLTMACNEAHKEMRKGNISQEVYCVINNKIAELEYELEDWLSFS